MIEIAIDFLGHVKRVIQIVMSGNVRVDPAGSLTISIFSLFVFYWVIWLFLRLFHQWSHNQRR